MDGLRKNMKCITGFDAGKHILNKILNAKRRLVIVSPFIDSFGIDILREISKKGIDITLITRKIDYVTKWIKVGKNKRSLVISPPSLKGFDENIKILYANNLHTKIYIIDDKAYIGSLNLLEKSLTGNSIETICTYDKEEAEKTIESIIYAMQEEAHKTHGFRIKTNNNGTKTKIFININKGLDVILELDSNHGIRYNDTFGRQFKLSFWYEDTSNIYIGFHYVSVVVDNEECKEIFKHLLHGGIHVKHFYVVFGEDFLSTRLTNGERLFRDMFVKEDSNISVEEAWRLFRRSLFKLRNAFSHCLSYDLEYLARRIYEMIARCYVEVAMSIVNDKVIYKESYIGSEISESSKENIEKLYKKHYNYLKFQGLITGYKFCYCSWFEEFCRCS